MTRLLSLVAALLLPALALAGEPVTFAPREAPRPGQSFTVDSRWTSEGHTDARIGKLTVKDEDVQTLNAQRFAVKLIAVEGEVPSQIEVAIEEVVSRRNDDLEDLGLDGVLLDLEGLPPKRHIRPREGHLSRKQKKWLEPRFNRESGPDPLEFLLPAGPVEAGANWPMSIDAIEAFFDPETFQLDREKSSATATLQDVIEVAGEQYGLLGYDVMLVPAHIKDMTFEEAQMRVVGTAEVPLRGDLPFFAFDLRTDLHFVGTAKKMGLTANVNLDTVFLGRERRSP